MKHWYHATYYGRLGGIAEHGLSPRYGGSGAIGQAGHRGHSRGKVFFTDEDGAVDWFYKAEYVADVELGPYQPNVAMMLRFPDDALPMDPIKDPAGEYPAWYVTESIEPDDIEVYDGAEWVPLEDWDGIDAELALEPAEEPDPDDYEDEDELAEAWARIEDTDDDEREYGGFKSDSPFLPPELRG